MGDREEAKQDQHSVRRCGEVGEGDDDIMTIGEVLKEQETLEEEADAVLGDSDSQNCSYPKGYLKRQAVYACATCKTDGLAGICLACANECHDGHDLYEIYTKRNFRCDCGNEKFGTQICKLYPDKFESNTKNKYNQNYRGLYCICSRPYPDEDDHIGDEMIQCVICEDWLHGRHLKTELPEEDFMEMICPDCMTKHPFLWKYQVSTKTTKMEQNETKADVQVCCDSVRDLTSQTAKDSSTKENPIDAQNEESSSSDKENQGVKRERDSDDEEHIEKKRKSEKSQEEQSAISNAGSEEVTCVLSTLKGREAEGLDCAAFWPEGWRDKLCRCPDCLAMYAERDVEFLTDAEDTVAAYEARGKAVPAPDPGQAATQMMAGLGRVQQIEVVRGIMDFQTNLSEFLQNCAREGKVVTESDIREFFSKLGGKKKEKSERRPSAFLPMIILSEAKTTQMFVNFMHMSK